MKGFLKTLIIALPLALLSCGHAETADEEAAFVVSGDEIVQSFLDNEQESGAKYIDQIIQVTGPIMELSKENGQVTSVMISSDEYNIVSCTFQNPVDLDEISGDQITVKGVCSGFLGDASSMIPGGTVELKRSSLVIQ
ncbi:OB-fold putative lipoprotein [Salibacteraceae bacterium]|jgi:hypothetical protein|nr:OB-fold putative lipoprotein [Salibacteraceae bacterium]MDB4105198.1 OB-fold putative lipoprotein [Salibacteraceae bacterium]MDB9708998.1 OB-fold putative lipoprotein [Salibacteraceae bacterium]MDC1305159.1 OB-fold putative lipoprotein [Salibacteraceae bacterium]